MNDSDNRQITRASLFIMAGLRLGGEQTEHRVKVRNLSPSGLMAETAVKVSRGATVQINLRNIGWTEGVVAWVQDNRFGVAFRNEIDPAMLRVAAKGEAAAEAMLPRRFPTAPVPGLTVRKLL